MKTKIEDFFKPIKINDKEVIFIINKFPVADDVEFMKIQILVYCNKENKVLGEDYLGLTNLTSKKIKKFKKQLVDKIKTK